MNKSIREQIKEWDTYTMAYNPYGEPLPEKFLNTTILLKDKFKNGKTFGEYKQNGYLAEKVCNNYDKNAPWEAENPIIFSDIRERLYKQGTLCISNFLVETIKELKKAGERKNITYNDEYVAGTLCRGIRTFASFVRECELKEDIENIIKQFSVMTGKTHSFEDISAKNDVKEKTDILFKYDNVLYRVWSYQCTESGINKTSHRIVGDNGKSKLYVSRNAGINLLLPFDMHKEKETINGWFLYDKNCIRRFLVDVVFSNKEIVNGDDFIRKVYNDRNTIGDYCAFLVD